jgi:hypothetical protein
MPASIKVFALKAGLCVRRTRLVIVAPDLRHFGRSQAEIPLIDLALSRHTAITRLRQIAGNSKGRIVSSDMADVARRVCVDRLASTPKP